MSAAHAMARATKSGVPIKELSRIHGRAAALQGRPAWDCPEGFDAAAFFLGHAEGWAERMCCGGERAEPEQTQ